ncbi:MAG: hypothetical protein K2P81_01280 [Bacteriovoracaceae bacterium]|nr:hypothetical protein [Bacteriovoracaceae bacterium]
MRILFLIFLFLQGASVWASKLEAQALRNAIEIRLSSVAKQKIQTIKLPVTRGFDQKDSQLCWVHSFLNAQETLYLIKHPREKMELSRSYFQYQNLKDRMSRLIESEEEFASERGTPLDAFSLAQEHGLLRFEEYSELLSGIDGRYPSIIRLIKRAGSEEEKYRTLEDQLKSLFAPLPNINEGFTHEILKGQKWIAYAPGSKEGWALHPDSDARLGTVAYFMKMSKIIEKIRTSLQKGIPVTYGGNGHSVLIYGAELDSQFRPQKYFIKDSYSPYFYSADPQSLHENLLEVSIPEN